MQTEPSRKLSHSEEGTLPSPAPESAAGGPQNFAGGPQNFAGGPQNFAGGPQRAAGGGRAALIRALLGLMLGLYSLQAAQILGLTDLVPPLRSGIIPLIGALICMGLSLTRLRWLVAGFSLGICLLDMLISYTPIMRGPANSLVESSPLQKCDVIVPLTSDVHRDGNLDDNGELRMLRALELLKAGYGREMLITRIPPPTPSGLGDVQRQMKAMGIQGAVEQVGPIGNTHDEAVAVAQLAHQRGWTRVLVVTSPLHTRRAAAVFRKTGLTVVVEPCIDRRIDLSVLRSPMERCEAFQSWLREVAGWQVYRLKGWI